MAEPSEVDQSRPSVTERFDRYRAEVEQIVTLGIEHPNYELKRSATIARDYLADRLDFVKLIQGLANADIAGERFIIVGADQKERKFYDVGNAEEFDPAKLGQVISKYLDPPPLIEVFNNARAESGELYVVLVLSPDQPRPIVAACEGTSEKTEKRTHFRQGDIWIKKNTSLQLAARADLNAMYEKHIDKEAENRARRRFQHFREEISSTLTAPQAISMPNRGLLIGARKELQNFAASTLSTSDVGRFKIQLEMARERLVEEWDAHQVNGPGQPEDPQAWITEINEFYRDGFLPSLESTVELGLQIIKYDGPDDWLGPVIDALVDTFEVSRRLDRLRSGHLGAELVSFSRPAFEAYIGVRALATYAVMRQRMRFLGRILPRLIRLFTLDNCSRTLVPLIFWPFGGQFGFPDMGKGRNRTLWNERIQSAWAAYFGTIDNFLSAASRLEFILELNSYVLLELQDPVAEKVRKNFGDRHFEYEPDFWASRLDDTVPMAERLYDLLSAGDVLPQEYIVAEQAINLVLKGKGLRDRLLFLGDFLDHLRAWQKKKMWQSNRFPFMFSWPDRLEEIAVAYAESQKPVK